MAAVYKYLDNSGPIPREMILLNYIDRFGVEAVMKRPYLGAGEMRRMMKAQRIREAYWSRAKSDNWVDWANTHPEMNTLLEQAMMAVKNG